MSSMWSPNAASGVYTPTATLITNLDAVTTNAVQWMQSGAVVSVWGYIEADPTAGGSAATSFRITLPITSNITTTQLAGTACAGGGGISIGILGDGTNDAATFNWSSTGTANFGIVFSFGYRVI